MTTRRAALGGVLGTRLLWGLVLGLVVVAALAISVGLRSSGVGPASAPLIGRSTILHPAREAGLVRSQPVHLSIPALDVSTSLSSLGLNADGTVSVPSNFNQPGWYRYGAAPGQLGTAVILGHVDSFRGPAVFFNLRNLVVGDRVTVRLADGATARYAVIGVAVYLKAHFPRMLVYGRRSYGALQLVTCGGVFDHATGSYLSNIVVYTAMVGR